MPILLEDYRKISVERRGVEQKDFFTSEQIKQCMLKVRENNATHTHTTAHTHLYITCKILLAPSKQVKTVRYQTHE